MGLALLAPRAAQAEAHYEPATADATVLAARKDGHDGFCKTPPNLLLSPRGQRLCKLAKQVPDCAELVTACDRLNVEPESKHDYNLGWLGDFLAVFGRTAMWFVVAAVPLFILWLVLDASIKARRDKQVADKPKKPALVTSDPVVHVLETITDAERLLAMAAEEARRGQFDHAQALYLAASLAALDRRGAIRLAKHRTNGEYVRACKEVAAKPELRAIVREVDRVHFGKEAPTGEGVAQVAARAAAIVRAVAVTATMALLLLGCNTGRGPVQPDADPGGDGLFMQLLERQGAKVGRPDHSLATLPMPTGDDAPVVVVDASRTLLEPDAKTHLVRWVRAGGRLILFGGVESWPDEVGAHAMGAGSREVKLRFLAGDMDPDEVVDDDGYAIYPAHVAELVGVRWKEVGDAFGETGDHVDYAGLVHLDKGIVVGVASDDLITNVGLATPPNARAVVALLTRYAGPRRILVARPEDGVSPPSGPIASLVHAGLGLALGHAAVATLLLLLAFGIRQARARPTPEPARRAWTEHVAATGTLYARSKLAPHALATYARFVDGRLRTRMPRGMTDPAAFLAIRSGEDAGHCTEVWARAMASRAGDRVQGDEMTTLADLRELYAATVKTE
jgi:hypothetical protein